ncbi:MAG: DUF362 domain-containing protein [Treponema sp.]|nr:DUF362 domain-containing protein [Treponema sp.]
MSIYINYGKDWVKTTYDTLAASDIGTFLKPSMAVSVKPNLVTPKSADNGSTTHPEVVEGIILFLKDFGIQKINIIENSAAGYSTKQAFRICGYEMLSERYNIPLVDLQNDNIVTLKHGNSDIRICETALNTEFLINVPVLKAHCQTRLTCCMKNLKGCMPHDEMKRFHTLGLHKPIAALNALLKTHYCVVDGICGDLSFEEGGTPVEANRIIAGQNPVLIDSYNAELIGYKPDEIDYLSYGKKLGLGEFCSMNTKVVELNPDRKPLVQVKSNRLSDKYRNLIEEDSACSVCYAALIFALHRKGGHVLQDSKIFIGQGFKGKKGNGNNKTIGIGNCAGGFDKYIKGCPPKAVEILSFLKNL